MTLNVTLGQQTPLVVKLGQPTGPGAITPTVGNATLGDALYNYISSWVKNQVAKSATVGRIELRATAGQPAFVSVAGRWAVVSSTIFVDVAGFSGTGYLFADLSANNNTFVLVASNSATPGPWQTMLANYSMLAGVVYQLNTSSLGYVGDNGLLALDGSAAALFLGNQGSGDSAYWQLRNNATALEFARSGAYVVSLATNGLLRIAPGLGSAGMVYPGRTGGGSFTLYRDSSKFFFDDGINGTVFSFTDTGIPTFKGLSTAGYVKNSAAGVFSSSGIPIPITDGGTGGVTAAAARTALGAAGSPANADITSMSALATIGHALGITGATTIGATSGVTPLAVSNVAGQSVDTFKVDASAVTNGQIVHVDQNGHVAVSQAALPTIAISTTGAGVGATAVFAAGSTDQSGVIQLTTAGAPGVSSLVATISFKTAMATAPRGIAFCPANAAAQTTGGQQAAAYFSGYSTGGWTITSGGTALTTGTVYQWSYVVL